VLGPPIAACVKELIIYFNNPPRYGVLIEEEIVEPAEGG